jgi:hypothetical protein
MLSVENEPNVLSVVVTVVAAKKCRCKRTLRDNYVTNVGSTEVKNGGGGGQFSLFSSIPAIFQDQQFLETRRTNIFLLLLKTSKDPNLFSRNEACQLNQGILKGEVSLYH